MSRAYDAVVVGAGPNGLAAAIVLARAGWSVLVLEAARTVGGGCRSDAGTLPGFLHDVCAAVHPMAVASPFFAELPLAAHGVEWIEPPAAVAHPFDDGTAAVLYRSVDETGATLGPDADAWARVMRPFVRHADAVLRETMRPIRVPRHPWLMARFGVAGLQSCARLVRRRFRGSRARALFAGNAAHSFLPLDAPASASFGLVLSLVGHVNAWPIVRGGSQRLTDALAGILCELGGEIQTGRPVRTLHDVPPSRAVLFDLAPSAVDRIAGDALPDGYRRQLRAFRHGVGVFKIDWALAGPIPWAASACRAAATVHVGGSFEEIAASEHAATHGQIAEQPFVLVAQPSVFDATRAPQDAHTGWAYCHVPWGSTVDMTDRIERQIERFAPGFGDLILARRVMSATDLEAHNANMVGGDVSGGANDLAQLIFRPVRRWNPYTTPNPRLFLCSSSTPPGGGVHGMCGYWAAHAVLTDRKRG